MRMCQSVLHLTREISMAGRIEYHHGDCYGADERDLESLISEMANVPLGDVSVDDGYVWVGNAWLPQDTIDHICQRINEGI